jgi:uncharacterized membrane protein YdfJ with MMPL/SSD domain
MKPVAVMVAVSVGSWLLVSLWLDARSRVEVLFGMLGPLAMVAGTWVLVGRTHRRNPQMLMSLMVAAFGFKLAFFGVYVVVMVGLLSFRPVPFVASFASYFSGLYLIEALYLRRLFR